MSKRGTESREAEEPSPKRQKEDSSSSQEEVVSSESEDEELFSPTPYIEELCGKLSKDDETEFVAVKELYIPFLDTHVDVSFLIPEGGNTPEKLEKYFKDCEPAFKNMMAVTQSDKLEISPLVTKYALSVIKTWGMENDEEFENIRRCKKNPEEIWNLMAFSHLNVTRRESDGDIYFIFVGDPTWDEEHGVQLSFRQGFWFMCAYIDDSSVCAGADAGQAKSDEFDERWCAFNNMKQRNKSARK